MIQLHVCLDHVVPLPDEAKEILNLLSFSENDICKLMAYYHNLLFNLTLRENHEEIIANLAMFRIKDTDLYNQIFLLTIT